MFSTTLKKPCGSLSKIANSLESESFTSLSCLMPQIIEIMQINQCGILVSKIFWIRSGI